MAEKGSRTPASSMSALDNLADILKEQGPGSLASTRAASDTVQALRQELKSKGLRDFKRGGLVKETGLAKVHKGERVLTAAQAQAYTKPAGSAYTRSASVSLPRGGKRR